jgi:hypothetical protein
VEKRGLGEGEVREGRGGRVSKEIRAISTRREGERWKVEEKV